MVAGVTLGRMSVKDQSTIRYFKCYNSHEMGAQQCIKISGVTLGHNIAVVILILTRILLVLSFHTYEDCMNYII